VSNHDPYSDWEHSERICAPDFMTDERRPIRRISRNLGDHSGFSSAPYMNATNLALAPI
jgi:hypothetical protein